MSLHAVTIFMVIQQEQMVNSQLAGQSEKKNSDLSDAPVSYCLCEA